MKNVTGNLQTLMVTGRSVVINGQTWTYYEHLVTGIHQATISGTGLIDEVRLYPKHAQMKTFTYKPSIGITSQCDINNVIVYYEYDAFGRLKLLRDLDRNILKSFQYKYNEPQ